MALKIIIANWKMNPLTIKEVEVFLKNFKLFNFRNVEVIICPPFPFLYLFGKTKSKKIKLGAQNISSEISGAYTGEVSASMVSNLKASHVILGHSECRARGETDQDINKKILIALKYNLTSILCLGEKERDERGDFLSFVESQLKNCLLGVPKNKINQIIFAYEPIWAIGKDSKREATVEEFIEMKIFIKKIISNLYDVKTAEQIKIIYGGSVSPENAQIFVKEGKADGLLVGRDSLNIERFKQIITNSI